MTKIERAAYARGLRAAARKARREARYFATFKIAFDSYSGKELAMSKVSRWCDRRARAVEKGKR